MSVGMIGRLIGEMICYYKDLKLSEHALKVYAYARGIGGEEGLGSEELEILLAAAVLHDIGIPAALKAHGSAAGPYQEKEGAAMVPAFLEAAGAPTEMTERVRWLVGHHHTEALAGEDILLQMLIEADYLVNLAEGYHPELDPGTVRDTSFKTAAGRRYITALFGLKD